MKKFILAVVLLCLVFGFAGTAWADINVQTVNTAPDSQAFTLFNTDTATVNNAIYDAVYETIYLDNSFPAFNNQDFNLFVVSQAAIYGGFEQGDTIYGTNDAYLFTINNQFFINRVPSLVAHELGHEVRFMYLTTKELDQYIAQRGITDAERACFHKYYPDENINEEVFAEDFRQLFGGPYAQVAIYYDNIPAPTEQDRQWMLEHLPDSK